MPLVSDIECIGPFLFSQNVQWAAVLNFMLCEIWSARRCAMCLKTKHAISRTATIFKWGIEILIPICIYIVAFAIAFLGCQRKLTLAFVTLVITLIMAASLDDIVHVDVGVCLLKAVRPLASFQHYAATNQSPLQWHHSHIYGRIAGLC